MTKLYALMPRRPELSVASFRHHWRHVHADLVRQITSIDRYVQSYPLEDLPGTSRLPYDGIAEIWYEDHHAIEQTMSDPNYLSFARRDEPTFIDMARHARLVASERVLLAGSPRSSHASTVKAIVFMADSVEESVDDWTSLSEARRIMENLVTDRSGSPYDRVLEIWWDDEDMFRADWAQAGPQLVEGRACTGVRVTEVRIIWPSETEGQATTRAVIDEAGAR